MRDKKKNFQYFEEYINLHSKLLEKIQINIENSNNDKERKERFMMAKGVAEYNLLKALYSAGNSLENVKKIYLDFLDDMEYFFNENSSILYMYDVLSLAVLFNIDKKTVNKLFIILEKVNREDGITNLYKKYFEKNIKIENVKSSYGSPYDDLLKIMTKDIKNKKNELLNYLRNLWYRGHSQAFWYNSHKDKQNSYVGYWSFEAGVIAKILGIDDSDLKDEPYYPYDLVHYCD